MIKCVAIDDEPLALEVIRLHCEKAPLVKLVASFLSIIEAIDFLNEHEVDVIFLDINMPEISGLNIKPLIPENIKIIFATAYEHHALESYDLGATDYLLKPISFERFYKAILRCREEKKDKFTQGETSINLTDETILLKGDKKITQISISDIDYIESLKDYAKIYFKGHEKIVIRESLKRILKRLEKHNFMRVHRSFIISIDKISSIYGNVIKIGNHEIPMNKSQRDHILKTFKERGILGDRSS